MGARELVVLSARVSWRRRLQRWRTPFIGALALAMLLWSAVDIWDVEPAALLEVLLICVIGVLIIVGAAFLFSLLLRWLRRR